MTTWTRAQVDTLCGYCGHMLAKDAPIQIRQLRAVKRNLVRGQCCAGPAPPDLPARIERSFPVLGGFEAVQSAKPSTRGELKAMAKEWMPYTERE